MSKAVLIVFVTLIFVTVGCSGSGSINFPTEPAERIATGLKSHNCWGLWEMVIDPGAGTMEAFPLRMGEMHLNALPHLEQPPALHVSVQNIEFNGNTVSADVGIRHPFLAMTQYTGFDVCGIFISNGSVFGFQDPDLLMAGEGDTRLLNADGLSRWWNPYEFPADGTMFAYSDGVLGTSNSEAHYNSTLNGYKYYSDELSTDDSLDVVDPEGRGVFTPGQQNWRKYVIELSDGGPFVFNYAVDACWMFPSGGPPYDVPDDFSPGANRPEAWRMSVTEISNTLYYSNSQGGGELHLEIDVYDWFNAGLNELMVESKGNFSPVIVTTPIGGGPGYSTYAIDITNTTLSNAGDIHLLISAISEAEGFQGFIPGVNTTAYKAYTADVVYAELTVTSPNGGETWGIGTAQEITWLNEGTGPNVKIEYSLDDFTDEITEITDSTLNDGSFIWDPIPDIHTAKAKVRITDLDNAIFTDTSDDFFSIAIIGGIYVDDSNTDGFEDGSPTWPYNTIQEAMFAAVDGDTVIVDDSGIDYYGPINMVDNVDFISKNWDPSDGTDQASINHIGMVAVTGAENATIDGFKIHGASDSGIKISDTGMVVRNCWIDDIACSGSNSFAHGIYVFNSPGVLIEDCVISDIRKAGDYGEAHGILLVNSPGIVRRNEISEMFSVFDNLMLDGIQIDSCDPADGFTMSVYENEIHDLKRYNLEGHINGVIVKNTDTVAIYKNVIRDFTRAGTEGYVSGVRLEDSSNIDIYQNDIHFLFMNGEYGYVQGVYSLNSNNVNIYNNLIYRMSRSGYYGYCQGIYAEASGWISITNNTIHDIEKISAYGRVHGVFLNSTTDSIAQNNIIDYIHPGGSTQWAYGVRLVSSSDMVWDYGDVYNSEYLYDGIGEGLDCLNVDPLFVTTGWPYDYHLQAESEMIDAGNPDASFNDTDGTRNDMGCYGGPFGDW